MPGFSLAGAAIASALGFGAVGAAAAVTIGSIGLTLGGALVASVVAAGLAGLTSRLINGGGAGPGGGTQQDPGVRVQLPPATDNKVPVVYGRANTKGIVTDARISSDNQVMTYVLILSEKTQSGAFTLGNVYWNDELLTFDTGSNNYKVASSRDQNGLGQSSTNLAGLVEMRVYAGTATNSASQIFPTTNQVAAATYIGESTSTYQLNDLVYAVVKLTYSAEKSVTALQQMTFEVINEVQNPGTVLYDYLTSPRYGAGISASEIDTDSMTNLSVPTSLRSISREIPPDQFNSNGSTSTQFRYIINGVLSTGETVKNNLEKITQACASWLTYDFEQGKWTVVVNRALGSSELAACIEYDDDSIIGEITVNATNLEDLYNSIEVEFPSREIRDQNDYYRASTTSTERNSFEPDNTLSLRYDLINNAIHAQRLGLIELNQSRVDKTIQFRTTYKGLQTKAGDVIKVTNEVYGFTEKLFRVTRVREVEDESGGLFAEITGLEYDAAVYGDTSITDYQPNTASGIPSFNSPVALPKPGAVTLGQIFTATNQPYFEVTTSIDATSGPVDRVLWYYSTSSIGTSLVYLTDEQGPFSGGQTVTDAITGLPTGVYYLYARTIRNGAISPRSDDGIFNLGPIFPPYTTYTHGIDWRPTPGGVNNGSISTATFSSQVQVTNTTTGLYSFALTTGTGFQPVFGDVDITYSPSANSMFVGGGIEVDKTLSAGGFPINSEGTATIFGTGQSPSLVVTNNTANLLPQIALRGYGQNRPGGSATTNPAVSLYMEGSRGTPASPTALQAGDGYALLVSGGYDGRNWSSDTGQINSFLGWFANENWTNNGSTGTNNAGTGFQIWAQPSWARTWANQSRQRIMNATWTTSSNSPSLLNLVFGSGTDGTTPTIVASDGTSYTGYGRTNFNILNGNFNMFTVPGQDTAPDNASLTATNSISFVSNRRSGTSGRRNPVASGDDLGVIIFRGQHVPNSTGTGLRGASISAKALEAFTSTRAGSSISIATVNSGTTTEAERLFVSDAVMRYRADQHNFVDKSGSFTSVAMNTATVTFTAIPVVPNYTAAGAAAITGQLGAMIAISNSTPGGRMAFWDTTNNRWSYVSDNSAV
jgi:hypothetical protein